MIGDAPRPIAEDVARRALCLSLLLYRLGGEAAYFESTNAEERDAACDTIADVQDFLIDSRLWEFVTPEEQTLFKAAAGTWTEEQAATAAWRREALGILLWALNVVPAIPPYDSPFEDLGSAVDMNQTEFFVQESFLVTAEDVFRATETAHAWLWRAQRGQPPFDEDNNPELIAEAALELSQRGVIPPPMEQDFALFGRPFHQLKPENVGFAGVLAAERLFALEWLQGRVRWP